MATISESNINQRAGRNLSLASIVGVGMLLLFGGALFLNHLVFIVLVAALIGLAIWELAVALRSRGYAPPLIVMVVGGLGMIFSAYRFGEEALLIVYVLTLGGVLVWRVLDGQGRGALRDIMSATFVVTYVPLLGAFVSLMLAKPQGTELVALFVLMCVASDVGGYGAGVLIGKHKMAPTVSPKKTWEGFGGSVVLTVAIALTGATMLFDASPLAGVLLGLVTVVAATLGDLSESLIKRDLGVKDMSSLIPGHGGVLDRTDSILFAAPVVLVFSEILLPMGVS